MNPYVTAAQAVMLAICVCLLSTVGTPTVAIVLTVVLLVSAALARLMDYPWRGRDRRGAGIAEYLMPLDGPLWVVVLLVTTLFSHEIPFVGGISVADVDESTVKALFIAASAALAAVYLSSLTDRYYISPRMRGSHWDGAMPCTPSPAAAWSRVTRIWLLHRMLANLSFVAGGTIAVAVTANHWIGPLNEPIAAAIAATATILAGFYLTRTAPVIALIINPTVEVGDALDLAEEFDVRDKYPTYYVVDVALEGLKLLKHDYRAPAARPPRLTHDRVLDVTDVSKLLRERLPEKPCSSTRVQDCRLVNPHCPHRTLLCETMDDPVVGNGA